MTIIFPPDLEAFVREEVALGRYTSEDDVIRDAVRRFAEARAAQDAQQLNALRSALAPGLAEARAGYFVEGGIPDATRRAADA